MKKILSITTALSIAATSIMAGDLSEPVVTELEEPEAASSSAPWLILLVLGAGLLIATQDDNSSSNQQGSDRRIKRDIIRVGTAENGLPIYQFKYLWSDTVYEGVMAQDVLKVFPKAVVKKAFGLLTVNYAMLGLEMKTVSA